MNERWPAVAARFTILPSDARESVRVPFSEVEDWAAKLGKSEQLAEISMGRACSPGGFFPWDVAEFIRVLEK